MDMLDLWDKPSLDNLMGDNLKDLSNFFIRLYLGRIGAQLTELSKDQADYINVPVEGPYKPDHYRY